MKKIISLLLLFAFCNSLASCSKIDINASIQGEWRKDVEAQSATQVTLYFSNGTVKRTETFAETKSELSGVYTIDDKGYIYIAYTDNTSQTLVAMIGTNGIYLSDTYNMVTYSRN